MSSVRVAWRYLLLCQLGAGMLVPVAALPQVAQERVFFETLFAACNDPANSTNTAFLITCANTFTGGLAGGVYTPGVASANVGSAGSYGTAGQAALQRQREFDEALGDEVSTKKRKKGGGSSGDFTAGPFGGFLTAQTSRTTRALTELENGYKAKLDGLLIGLDRRFGNDLVAGASLGHSDTDNNYISNAGTMRSRNTTLLLYATYLPTPRTYLGAYLGGGRGSQDATRRIDAGVISGVAASSIDSQQVMAGLAGGYNWYSGALTVSATAGADYIRNRTDQTTETGTTGLEFIYSEQSTTSLTSTLGTRASYRKAFTWGAIVPAVRATYVHEFRDDARTVSPRLVVNPSTVFAFRTDSPDRDYFIVGAGATIEVGRGTQFFLDYEKRGGHSFIDTWSANIGVIAEF